MRGASDTLSLPLVWQLVEDPTIPDNSQRTVYLPEHAVPALMCLTKSDRSPSSDRVVGTAAAF